MASVNPFERYRAPPPPAGANPFLRYAAADFDRAEEPEEPGVIEELGHSIARGANRATQAGAILAGSMGLLEPEMVARSVAEDERDIAQLSLSRETEEGLRQIVEADGFLPALVAAIRNPQAVASVAAESLPLSAPSLAGGALGLAAGGPVGAAGGAAAGSFATEFAVSLHEALSEAGYDLSDESEVVAAFNNENVMAKAREHAVRRGIPIAAFDALSFGVAGRLAGPAYRAAGGGVRGTVAGAGAELAPQMATGAAGEAGAQLLSEGEITSPGEIVLEAAAEIPGAVTEPAVKALAATGVSSDNPFAAYAPEFTTPPVEPETAPEEIRSNTGEPFASERLARLYGGAPGNERVAEQYVLAEADGGFVWRRRDVAAAEDISSTIENITSAPTVEESTARMSETVGEALAQPVPSSERLVETQIPVQPDIGLAAIDALRREPPPEPTRTPPVVEGISYELTAPPPAPGTTLGAAPPSPPAIPVEEPPRPLEAGSEPGAAPPPARYEAGIDYEVQPKGPNAPEDLTLEPLESKASVPPERPESEVEAFPRSGETDIDAAANQAATSPENALPEPTDAQKDAGNYAKGHVTLHGFDISIENPAGSTRSGTAPNGSRWENELTRHYGYIRGSEAVDGDHVDVYLGEAPEDAGRPVFVIDQVAPETGVYDEAKVVLGDATEAQARDSYLSQYEDGWKGLGAITAMPLDEFKAWVADPVRSKRPVSPGVPTEQASAPEAETDQGVTDAVVVGARPAKKARPAGKGTDTGSIEGIKDEIEKARRAESRARVRAGSFKGDRSDQAKRARAAHRTARDRLKAARETLKSARDALKSPEELAARKAAAQQRARQGMQISDHDGVGAAIAKLGGISRESAESEGWGDYVDIRGHGIHRVFTRSGHSPDAMATLLADHGFPLTNAEGRVDARMLEPLLDAWLRGDRTAGRRTVPTEADVEAEAEAFFGRPESESQDPADDFDPANWAEEEAYYPEMDAFGRRHVELAARLEELEEGAAEAILERAATADWSDSEILDALEEAIRDRTERTGTQEAEGVEGEPEARRAPDAEAPSVGPDTDLLGQPLRAAPQQVAQPQGDLLPPASAEDEATTRRQDVERERVRRDREAAEQADAAAGETAGPLFQKAEAEAAGQGDLLEQPAAQPEAISDFGEKIGGARKDTSTRGEPRKREPKKDDRPGWRKRYKIRQIAKSNRPEEEGRWSIEDTRRRSAFGGSRLPGTFATEEDAELGVALAEVARNHIVSSERTGEETTYAIVRKVTDRKRVTVRGGFESREDAMRYMAEHAVEIIETKTGHGGEMRISTPDPERTGPDYRGGRDATATMFAEDFGFRGVEFGNWNNQAERQLLMNHAYDALRDLAIIIDVPPRALSLNGELALAFGARGTGLGSGAAHYERDRGVINLTKMQGAGALAHEWMHAVDHYFGRVDGKAKGLARVDDGTRKFPTQGPRDFFSHGKSGRSGVRQEVRDAWTGLMDTIFARSENYVEDSAKATAVSERTAKALDSQLESIRSDLATERPYGKRHTKPATTEQLAEFDALADKVRRGVGMEEISVERPNARRYAFPYISTPTLEALSTLHKAVRGRSGWDHQHHNGPLNRLRAAYASHTSVLQRVEEAEARTEKTRKVATEYLKEAKEIDRGRRSDYWSTEHEMLARAFEAYIQDQATTGTSRSDFLAYGTDNRLFALYGIKPYPEGQERTDINAGFERLFDVLETEATEQGVALRSRTEGRRRRSSPAPTALRSFKLRRDVTTMVRNATELWPGAPDIQVVDLETELPVEPTGDTAGLWSSEGGGRVYLVLEHLQDAHHAAQVLLEEVVAHHGLRGMLGDQLNPILDEVARAFPAEVAAVAERYDLDTSVLAQRREAAEEHLGDLAQDASLADTTVLNRAISAVMMWLRRTFPNLKWTRAEVRELIGRAHGFVGRGSRGTSSEESTTRRSRATSADPFFEENRRLREEHKGVWTKAKKQLRRQFAPGGLLPSEVFREKVARDSQFNVTEFDTRYLVGRLESAIRQEFGVSARKLTDAQHEMLSAGLSGKMPASMPERTRDALLAMRQYIDGLSRDYLSILRHQEQTLRTAAAVLDGSEPTDETSRLEREQAVEMARAAGAGDVQSASAAKAKADLIEIITGNLGRYVHRSYRAFDDPSWHKHVPTEVANAARRYLIRRYQELGESAAEARRLAEVTVHEVLKSGKAFDNLETFVTDAKLGGMDLSVLIERKQIAPPIRALLGEHRDPRVNFARTTTKMARLIWNYRFLESVRESGMGVFLFAGKSRPPEAAVQIAADGSETYSPLNGLWTYPEVAQAFEDALGREQMAAWYRGVVQLNGMVKYGKTILSPTTAMRNWQSAFLFAVANGHLDLRHLGKSLGALREYFTTQGDAGKLKYLRRLQELGVIYDTPHAGELAKLLEDSGLEEKLLAGDAKMRVADALRHAQRFYSLGDDAWKVLGFESEKRALMKHAGMTEEQADKEAAERVRNLYPTYSMTGRAIQSLRRFPLAGTFVSFPAEIVRTSINILQVIAKDMKTPGMRPLALRRAAGFSVAMSFAYALQELSKHWFGIDEDDEEAIRTLAAPWQRNANLVFTGYDENGELRYTDLSHIDAYSFWKRPLTAILRDEPWEDQAVEALREVLEPFLGTDIAAGAIFEVVSNKRRNTGGKVYDEHALPHEQTAAIANHLRKNLQPGVLSNVERTLKALQGERTPSGKRYDIHDELLAWGGWRVSTLSPTVALYYRSFEFTDALAEASGAFNRRLRDPNEVDNDDLVAAYERALAARERAFTDMGRIVKAARNSGLSSMEVARILRASNVSRANAAALMRGVVPPWQPSAQTARRAVYKARLLVDAPAAGRVRQRYNQVPRRMGASPTPASAS